MTHAPQRRRLQSLPKASAADANTNHAASAASVERTSRGSRIDRIAELLVDALERSEVLR
jgi:hypothetical protein